MQIPSEKFKSLFSRCRYIYKLHALNWLNKWISVRVHANNKPVASSVLKPMKCQIRLGNFFVDDAFENVNLSMHTWYLKYCPEGIDGSMQFSFSLTMCAQYLIILFSFDINWYGGAGKGKNQHNPFIIRYYWSLSECERVLQRLSSWEMSSMFTYVGAFPSLSLKFKRRRLTFSLSEAAPPKDNNNPSLYLSPSPKINFLSPNQRTTATLH